MKPAPRDAWVFARLVAGQAINGDLATVSESLRPLAERLASTPPEGRQSLWDGFLLGQPDRDDIIRHVAGSDPTGPAPGPLAVGEPGKPTAPVVKLICAADIEPREVEWHWDGRVPLGMLTLFAGDPKLGKSYVTIAMAAAMSRGAPLPEDDAPEGPASVILMSAEDDPARTIVPRLKAAGADLSRVHILESILLPRNDPAGREPPGPPIERFPTLLAHDLAAIEAAAAKLDKCKLIVVDPVSAYLAGTDDHRNAELRGVLSPLKAMAERLNAAVLLVSHLSKAGGTNGKHRVIGSIAFVGACRANFLFVRDRNDPTGRRVLMCDNGGNLAPTAPTLAYVIEDRSDGARVEWLDEPVAITVDEALAAELEAGQNPEEGAERRECDDWLRETLAQGRRVLVADIRKAGAEDGFSLNALKRAKRRIGARTDRDGFGPGSKCYWILEVSSASEPDHTIGNP
jgi:putative DNA primase/helicase